MKFKVFAILMGLICFTQEALAEDGFYIDPAPVVSIGARFGQKDINENSAFVGGVKLEFLSIGDDYQVSFLSPGIHFQSDSTLAPLISPISITTRTGINFGIDVYPINSNQYGGILGFSFGFKFY